MFLLGIKWVKYCFLPLFCGHVREVFTVLIYLCFSCLFVQVQTLDSVPDINMLVLLPEILDGLFEILGDQSQEIRKM